MKTPKLTEVKAKDSFSLFLRYDDGVTGIVSLRSYLKGPVFAPLKKSSFFKKVKVYEPADTVYWPNGADIAPETLYKMAKKASKK